MDKSLGMNIGHCHDDLQRHFKCPLQRQCPGTQQAVQTARHETPDDVNMTVVNHPIAEDGL